jgi:hypothetical protein
MKRTRTNGKRSFLINPKAIAVSLGGTPMHQAITQIEALSTLQWIFSRLEDWRSRPGEADVIEALLPGCTGGSPSGRLPGIPLSDPNFLADYLRRFFARLAAPSPRFARFCAEALGLTELSVSLKVRFRKPADWPFEFLTHLYGVRLRQSPNEYHRSAVWLHGARLVPIAKARRWGVRIAYSYRHENSTWTIGLDQEPGEKLESFAERIWTWLEPQIVWRHPEEWYSRFYCGASGMKKSELRSLGEAELKMQTTADSLRAAFSWEGGCPPDWAEQVGESLLNDRHEQFRVMGKIEMTRKRLAAVKRWINEDQQKASIRRAA